MIAHVDLSTGLLTTQPGTAPETWQDPTTGISESCFRNWDWDRMYVAGWREVIDNPLNFNILYEKQTISEWYYDLTNDIVTRYYSNELLSFPEALTNCFNKLDKNRELYEVSGFVYDYYGINVKIFTDRESSQPKLTACQVSAQNGTRLDTDVWKFTKIDDNSVIVVQLSNTDLLLITDFVFRKIQDSYNLQSYLAWQMLGTGNIETLKLNIENGIINLNPWSV